MKTSTAEANANHCPVCGDEVTEDPSGKGFVRHKTNPNCLFERGQKDTTPAPSESPQQDGGE
jgi:hypothetical protein